MHTRSFILLLGILLSSVGWTATAAQDPLDPQAQFLLGRAYVNGEGAPKNPAKGFDWFAKAAEQGHLGAKAAVGYCYFTGIGVRQDKERGEQIMREVAFKGDASGQWYYGKAIISRVRGGGANYQRDLQIAREGLPWMEKAVAQGGPLAAERERELDTLRSAFQDDIRTRQAWEARRANEGGGKQKCSYCGGSGAGSMRGGSAAAGWCGQCGGSGYR